MNFIFGFRVGDRDDDCAEEAGGVEPLRAAIIAFVVLGDRRAVENTLDIG